MLQYAPEHPVVPLLLKAVERMSDADKQTPSGKVIMSYVNLPKAVEIGDEWLMVIYMILMANCII